MDTIRGFTLLVGAMAAIVSCAIPLGAQSAPTTSQTEWVSIHLSLQQRSYAIGEKPIAILTIKNISSNEVLFPNDFYHVRIHVTGKDGEPPKTELHRHILGDFRPGDSNVGLEGGSVVALSIASGSEGKKYYNLTHFYDLSAPGDYSVYIEIYDPSGPKDGSGHWLRTNTAKFEILAPAK